MQETMDEKEKDRILKRFSELIPNPECPMCLNRQFTIVDSYITMPVADEYQKLSPLFKRAIPSVGVICTRCGYISIHSMSVMKLMDIKEKSVNDNRDKVTDNKT